MINIVCVLQENNVCHIKYTPEWAQKLKRSFERNLTVPHRFVCFSNMEVEGVEVIPLEKETWWAHWAKMEIFRPGVLEGPTIYSDIDALVCKNIDELTTPKENLVMIRDYYPHIYNSSLMYFDASDPIYAEMYQYMCDNEDYLKGHYEWSRHGATHGDQALIYDYIKEKKNKVDMWDHLYPSEWFLQFSGARGLMHHAAAWDYKSPARYVFCMGRPKFHIMRHLPLVQEHWV